MKRRSVIKAAVAGGITAQLPSLGFANALNVHHGWRLLGSALSYLPQIAGFGSSPADATASASTTNVVYIDPYSGVDTNAGTFASPKKTLPLLPASDTKYLVKAGTSISFDWTTTAVACNILSKSKVVISVYDPVDGHEITDQPQPFVRAKAGGWFTPVEAEKKYFKLVGNGGMSAASYPANNGKFFLVNGSSSNIVIRGAYMDGAAFCAVHVVETSLVRLEDCIISNTGRIPAGPTTNSFGGNAIRLQNNPPTAGQQIVRCFIDGAGDDCIHAAEWTYGTIVTDCAIRAHANFLYYSSQHADALQFPTYPGNFVLRRNVIEHFLPDDRTLVNDGGDGIYPIGACFISAGENDTRSCNGLIEDCILLSNRTALNRAANFTQTNRRVLTYVRRTTNSWPMPVVGFAGWTELQEQYCASVFENARNGDVLYNGSPMPTSTGNAPPVFVYGTC